MGIVEFKVLGNGTVINQKFGRDPVPQFNEPDIEVLKSKSGVAKIHDKFTRSHFKFRMFTIVQGDILISDGKDFLKEHHIDLEVPDTITCIYTNNRTTNFNYIPLSAWIYGHRFGHMFQIEGGLDIENVKINESNVMQELRHSMETLAKLPVKVIENRSGVCLAEYCFMLLLGTMRSVRRCDVSSNLEIFPELVAQYLICGKISLLPYSDWKERLAYLDAYVPSNYSLVDRMASIHPRLINVNDSYELMRKWVKFMQAESTPEAIATEIADLETRLNIAMHTAISNQVGKVLYF
jgi:hypothetical protein